jgi:hypothetical protein
MTETTIEIVKTVLKVDPTVSIEERKRFIQILQGAPLEKQSTDRLLKRGQVAEMLSSSARLVDKLSEEGLLHKVTYPGRKRCAGYRQSEVEALLAESMSCERQPEAEIFRETI